MYVQARSASAKYWLRNYPHIWCYLCVFIRLANPLIFGFLFAPHFWFGGIRTSAMFACMRSHTTRNLTTVAQEVVSTLCQKRTIKSWKKTKNRRCFSTKTSSRCLVSERLRSRMQILECTFFVSSEWSHDL